LNSKKFFYESKVWLVQHTNPRKLRGRLQDALRDANVFIGVSGPGIVEAKHLRRMAPKPIVFALANPTPEIMPEEAARVAFIVATGRSDYLKGAKPIRECLQISPAAQPSPGIHDGH
jgi:malate dehydrogenase (oxaloacetate-decarboxylating)